MHTPQPTRILFTAALRTTSRTTRWARPRTTRPLATHPPRSSQDPPLSSSTQDLLDRLAKEAARNAAASAASEGRPLTGTGSSSQGKPYVGNVGPFPMGVGLGSNIRTKDWKKWRDLGIGGKVVRMTTQTGNLTVILLGGTLFALLTYALTTELFAKNSPTVLHNQAIDLIESSKVMPHHLLKPYSFTHTPSSSGTTRHSSPIQMQHTRHPHTQNDHLIMRFWVHGRGIDEVETLGWLKQPLRDLQAWAEAEYENLREQYLMDRLDEDVHEGDAQVRLGASTAAAAAAEQQQAGGWWAGMFGALKPNMPGPARGGGGGGGGGGKRALPPPGTYTSGEARADFVKDPSTGTYRLLTLTVDIPSARSIAQRAVVFWADSADVSQEGLLEGSKTRLSW
ncbi:hypothetical protein NliqN6_4893 [Naganishia liquefaciens]|uniref:Mitochondrial import inner membrane translocase subunit Tim21 n=1 Tax=Naganishia liquefaciens TaxID=104408 RepID=A0A8H3TX29_9TREE|nr:hypothetical protein NliqN6_4893 [Naganishia liquefaciens]